MSKASEKRAIREAGELCARAQAILFCDADNSEQAYRARMVLDELLCAGGDLDVDTDARPPWRDDARAAAWPLRAQA